MTHRGVGNVVRIAIWNDVAGSSEEEHGMGPDEVCEYTDDKGDQEERAEAQTGEWRLGVDVACEARILAPHVGAYRLRSGDD